MAIHTLTFGDGATIQVEAPRGTSKEDLVDLVNKQERADREAARLRRQEARQAEMEQGIPDFVPIPEETGVLGDLRKGFGAGFVGTGEMAALGAATLLDEEAELAARSKIQGIADAIKPKGGDQDDLSYKIGSVFGSIAGFAAPIAGIAAGIGAAPISLGAAATTGIATGAGALLGVGTAAGEASERARAAGATQEERNRAIRQAAPFGLLEVAPLGRFMRSVDVPVINRLMDQLGPEVVETMGQRISNAAVTGGAEAAQEATAEIVQNLAERGYNPERAILEGTGESAALGGGAGATIQFLVDAFTNSRKAGIDGAPQEVAPEAAPEGGIAGLLPSPAAVQRSVGPQAVAKFRSWEDANPEEAARLTDAERTAKIKQYYDELSVKQPESRYIPKGLQLTGPDDLGIQLGKPTGTRTDLGQTRSQGGEGAPLAVVDYAGEPTESATREQNIAAREKARSVVERARAELRSTGEVSSETFGNLREATRTGAIPFEETANILENTRFEPALDLIEGTDLPAGVAAPEVKTQPVQDKARFDAAVQRARAGGLGALTEDIARNEQAAQAQARERQALAAAERGDVEAFEQPDLFAIEREQDERKYGRPEPKPEAAPEPMTRPVGPVAGPEQFRADPDLLSLIEQDKAREDSARVRKATEAERQKQEDIDVDTELGLREMQARVTEPERRRKDRERPEQLSFRGDLRQPKTITKSTLTMKDAGEPLDARPTDTAASGAGIPPVGPSSADESTAAAPSASDTTAPDERGVGRAVRGTRRTDASTEPQPAPLEGRERQGPDRPVTRQRIPGTRVRVDKQTLVAKGKPQFVEDPTLAPAPVKETTKQQFATQASDAAAKKRAETAKAKEADATQAAKFAEQDADIQRQGKADSDKDAPAAPMTASDKNKILKLMDAKRTKAKGSQLANAVQKYFNQFPTFTAALDAIIYDVSMQIPNRTRNTQEYKDDPVLAKFYTADKDKNLPSMGKTSARRITDWLTSKDTGMSADLQKYVKSELQQGSQARAAQANYNAKDRVAEARSRLTPEELAELEIISAKDLQLPAELVIDTPIRPSVKDAINKGNLVDALNALRFTTPSKDIALLSKRLAETLGDTKIVARKNLRAEDGAPVAGYFDPADNTIYLDKDTGFTGHALLHEALHAATSGIIANKSHPLTKKLNRLFEETKEQLADEYGLTTMDEFVAEALSNPEFQTQLKLTTIKGRNPWQQMVRAISNFVRTLLGRPNVPDNSAYQAIDELVQEMIAVDYDGRAATMMYLKIKTPVGAAQAINELGAKVIKADKNFYDQAKELIGSNTPMLVKKMFLNLQPVNILGRLAESKIPMAPQLNNIINGMSSALRERNERLDPIVADLRKFKKDSLEKFNTLQALVPNATYERIDPRQADFNKAYGRDKNAEGYNEKEARAIHADLHRKWKSLGKEGQNLYAVVTNTFEASTAEVMKSIDENLAATIKDAATRKKAIDKLAKLLNMDRGVIKPFAPLTRQGNFRLAYNTIDPKTGKVERFVEYFTSERLREKAKRNLKEYNDGVLAKLPQGDKRRAYILKDWEEGTASTVASFSQAPPDSFVFNVLQTLKANNVDATTIDSIAALALDMMPERSFMQSFRKRGDVRGFLGDKTPTGMAEEAFDLVDMVQNKGRDYNRQIVQMQYGAKIQGFKNELREFAPAEKTSTDVGLFRDKLEQIANFAQRPTVPRWSQVATSAGYGWTMGFNLSSAAITTFDVFMSTAPRLMGKYGDKAAMKAMGSASAVLFRSPKEKMVQVMGPNGKMTNRKVNTGVVGFSIANYDFDAAGLPKELRDIEVLAEVATQNAQINQTLNQEQLDMGNTKDVMEKINSWNSFLFHHAERYNREVAMTATYMLELQRLRDKKGYKEGGKVPDLTVDEKRQAAMTAVTETEFTLGATASAGRPVYAQSGIGNMAMLFKRFAISKYYMMARMTDEAFKTAKTEDDKVNRRIAQKQLGRFLVSTGLFAGVAGMPLMGALGQIYDLFVDDDEDDFDAMLRKTVGEGLYKGVINEALGVEVASRISLNSLLYRPPIIEKDQSQFFTLIEQLGGPIVGIGLSIERGVGLVQEGEILKGTEAILPAAARNIIKGGKQAATGEVETRRGDAVVEDIGVMQVLGQFAGFANADVIKTYEINKNERRKDTFLRTERTRLLRAANIAAANGDASGYREALKKIRDYNRELPRSARSKNLIMPDTIKKSRRAFDQRTKKMVGGIEYTPFMLRSLDEYDQGIQLFN
jgi:hypothetical protein